MAALRRKFLQEGRSILSSYSLIKLLDFVAIGTIADCAIMANSFNNRIVTKIRIKVLKTNNRKCWSVFDRDRFSSQYIGFTVAPILNSTGRVSNVLSSVSFLLSDCEDDILTKFNDLKEQNEQRKLIQKSISEQALLKAVELDRRNNSLCILLKNGHSGIHGILSSKIKGTFGKPVIIFSQTEIDKRLISGSARGIHHIHIQSILDTINCIDKNIILKYCGHSGAAGLTIKNNHFNIFYKLFEDQEVTQLVKQQSIKLGSCMYFDFQLSEDDFSLKTLKKIEFLEPFGREFEKLLFFNKFIVKNILLLVRIKIILNLY